ncbi:MAG: TOBE domain-containing protein [Candidatus Cyclobacteriaceae bacterium M3_2C_046]
MKLDIRNVLKGRILELVPGNITTRIKLDLGNGNIITSIISNESVERMRLNVGEEAYAVFKSSEVVLGK